MSANLVVVPTDSVCKWGYLHFGEGRREYVDISSWDGSLTMRLENRLSLQETIDILTELRDDTADQYDWQSGSDYDGFYLDGRPKNV